MTVATRAVLSAALAAAVAGAALLGEVALVVVAALLAITVAVGWPALADAPARRGAGVVIGLGGVGGVAAVVATTGEPYLRELPEVFALAIVLAFVRELVRRDGRERLVESVAAVVSGVLVAASVAGWVAAGRTTAGEEVVVTGALALAVGSVVSAVRLRGWLSAVVTVVAAAGAGAGAAALVPDVDPLAGGLIGLAVGVLVATLHRLFDRLPTTGDRWPAVAGAVLPVTVTGVVVYVVARVLVG
ncbi:hypothetical protein [Cellulomonas sp. ATA003]|uniref:hypothetical protein n=1 Tax=Cellulomonas sp. ATA003 TaxID=3073064 RepID=UPI002873C724|nr:hypothetical protein [Cellulomonas sp. ATA003]WNB85890.1 hypothetical protein REH70_00695 [Cellulomonas sp. ATA003]